EAQSHGHLNLARVHYASSALEKARQELIRARDCDPPAPWQTVAYFSGLVNLEHGNIHHASADFEKILEPKNCDPVRDFDFTKNYVVGNELAEAEFKRAE